MKKIVAALIAIVLTVNGFSQTYKLNKATGKLVVYLGKVTIEGYDGSEIIFSNSNNNNDDDERAKGLRAIDGSGLDDNSGIGLNVTEKQNVIEVRGIGKKAEKNYKIKVPKAISIKCEFEKAIGSGTITVKNVSSEIEIAVVYNSVVIENVTGPLTVTSTYGKIDGSLSDNPKGPISLVSPYGHVDLAVDPSIKANVSLYSPYGEILASNDIKIDIEKQGEMTNYSASTVKGKINGGGLNLSIKSNWGKIYLRKKGDVQKLKAAGKKENDDEE